MKDAKVRVPRNTFTTKINHETIPNLKNSFLIKYVDETRDFGNSNNSSQMFCLMITLHLDFLVIIEFQKILT